MTLKELANCTLVKVIIFALVMFAVAFIFDSMLPVISMDTAIGQLEHSDESFIAMQTYNRIQSAYGWVTTAISLAFSVSIIRDIFKTIKFYMKEQEI